MAKRGRKCIEINWQQFEVLCSMQATLGEIVELFECCDKTIERAVKRHYGMNFVQVFSIKRVKGFISLRRMIWEKALAGNARLLIFLAKKYLFSENGEGTSAEPPTPPPQNEFDYSKLSDEDRQILDRLVMAARTR